MPPAPPPPIPVAPPPVIPPRAPEPGRGRPPAYIDSAPHVAPPAPTASAKGESFESSLASVAAEAPALGAQTSSEATPSSRSPLLGSPLRRAEGEAARPVAPMEGVQRRSNPWVWVAGAVALGLVGTVAVAAFLLREKPQDLVPKEPAEVATPSPAPSPGSKIGERIGGAGSSTPAPTPAASPSPTMASSTPSPAPSVAPSPAAILPVAARAAMLIASTQDPQKPAVSLGSVVWSAVPANPGQPGSSGVKADIDVTELKMHATMTLRKNVDATLPASHTIDLRLTFDDGAPFKGIDDIGVPQMRKDDPPGVTPLAGVRVKINDNYFLVGLNKVDADIARNVDAIAANGWFDIPILLLDKRIAKLTFEKSTDGGRVIADAIAAWK